MRKLRHVPLDYTQRPSREMGFLGNAWFPLHSHNPLTWDEAEAKEILSKTIANLQTCGGCRQHAIDYTKKNVPDFSTRESYHQYLWTFHNRVNERVGHPQFTWVEYESKWLKWKQVEGQRIGIASVNYEAMGGTETFHQALVPRLPGVIGFATQNDLNGDVEKLGVPCGQGIEEIALLALQSDTVISWNIDWHSLPRPKRLITVHHGSLLDAPSTRLCLQGDKIICVNQDVTEHVRTLTGKPVHCIEPAVDPDRIKPQNTVETNGKKICLWSHRFHHDKRPQLAIEIAAHLPSDWHMVLTGWRGEKLEANERCTILPPQHPGDWLAVADCFLSTSLFDGFGLSVAEAIAACVPVVSTPVGVASRPGLALTVDKDTDPETWAVAILASQSMPLPSRDLFGIEAFLSQWESVINTA